MSGPLQTLNTQYLKNEEITATLNDYAGRLEYKGGFTWDWNSALTSTMGTANCPKRHIEFSPLCFIPASPAERLDTIVHELCHIIRFWQDDMYAVNNSWSARCKRGHDFGWKFLMMRVGFKGERCHSVTPLGYKRR